MSSRVKIRHLKESIGNLCYMTRPSNRSYYVVPINIRTISNIKHLYYVNRATKSLGCISINDIKKLERL